MNNKIEKFRRFLPAARISLGLVLTTASILLISELFGFLPNESKATLDARKKISESLAIQFSILATQRDFKKIHTTLDTLVRRNSDILSAGLRDPDGQLKLAAGPHEKSWDGYDANISTDTHVIVPIFRGTRKWASVELTFQPLSKGIFQAIGDNSILRFIVFVAGAGFLGYLVIILITLRQLDPSAVIPERVSAAFNTLAEGLLILDEKEQIVLANSAFADKLGRSPESLTGVKASELGWEFNEKTGAKKAYPWLRTLDTGEGQIGTALILKIPSGDTRTLSVNSAPIRDGKGKRRGVLATFDDITELERKNDQLKTTVSELEKSQEEVERKNKELHFLATQDPLTGCLNRRAFNEVFEQLFEAAKTGNSDLTCLMVDIDHFKLVNDTFGHATGDEVIKLLADILRGSTRSEDAVGRYGGEEFCIVLPGLDLDAAFKVAERIRLRVKEDSAKTFDPGPRVTASLGVASIKEGASDPSELNNQADKALYVAKESGRNRVVKWDQEQIESAEQAEQAQETESPGSAAKTNSAPAEPAVESEESNPPGDVQKLQVRIKQLESIASKYSKELEYKKSYDALTGLPNQLLFFDRIQQAIARADRYQHSIAVLTLDIDLFRRVNNSFGREGGNALLKKLAERLKKILRDTDGITNFSKENNESTLSHLGADEFGILLTDLADKQSVTAVIKRIFEHLSEPVQIDKQQVIVSCNIGVSLYPDDGQSAEILLNQSEVARHYAKEMPGQNSYRLFDNQMHQYSMNQMHLESELRRAIEFEEFVLYYQPKMDMQSARVKGVEALIRWNHPTKGLLTPYEFIDVAEQTGLIVEIGDWVIRQACLQVKAWIGMGIEDACVAVNLSTLQLRQRNFADRIINVVGGMDLAPSHLELEITETVIMDNLDTAVETLNSLHDHGFRIAIDDFGTGYSSLNYLKHLPLDTLKIDRSFLQDILTDNHDKTIVKTIIAMAHSMDLSVTAEGVETQEQLALLRQCSCDEIQGYLFSRPVPAEEATRMVQSRPDTEIQFAS